LELRGEAVVGGSDSGKAGERRRDLAIAYGVLSVIAMFTALAVVALADLALIPALLLLFPGFLLLIVARAAGGYGLSSVGHGPAWWNVIVIVGALACVPLQSAIGSPLPIAVWAVVTGITLVVPEIVGFRAGDQSEARSR